MSTNSPSWYIPGEGKQPIGPFNAEQIIGFWRAGKISEKTVCWREGMSQWLPLARVDPFSNFIRVAKAPPLSQAVGTRLVRMKSLWVVGGVVMCLLALILGVWTLLASPRLSPRAQNLLSKLREGNPEARQSAIRELGDMGADGVTALSLAIADSGPGGHIDVSWRDAASALQNLGPETVPALTKALHHDKFHVKTFAAVGLGKVGEPAIPALTSALKDRDKDVRSRAGFAFSVMGPKAKPAIPALREALQDLDARDQAAIALAKIGPEGVSVLLVAVRDGDCHLRGAALFGLAADDTVVGPDATEAIPALIKAVRDKSTEGRYRWTAALVLGKIGPAAKAAVPDLIELIADRPQEAILALGEIGPDARDAVPVITRALEQPWLRDTAAAALARIGTAPRNDWGVPPPVTDTGHPKQGGASERSAPPSIALPPSPYSGAPQSQGDNPAGSLKESGVTGSLVEKQGDQPQLLPSPTEAVPIVIPTDIIDNKRPIWSPDGEKIAFLSHRPINDHFSNGGSLELCVMNPDGSDPKQIARTNGVEHFSWSPDGHTIAFIGYGRGDESVFRFNTMGEIYTIDANGSKLQKLTNGTDTDYAFVCWSPNGKWLAFTVYKSRQGGGREVWISKSDGKYWYKLTLGDDPFAWSPDSKRLAYGSNDGSHTTLYVIDIDGNNKSELIGAGFRTISWSPDSSRVFLSDGCDICAITPNGATLTCIVTKFPGRYLGNESPSFSLSPNGKFILFANRSGGATEPSNIQRLDLTQGDLKDDGIRARFSGPNVRQRFDFYPKTLNVTPVSEDRDVDPEWSPDGKKIVFVRNGEIWVMNSDGSGQTQLTFERTKVIELAKKKQKEENTKRKQALEKALQEERTGAAIPQDESSAQPLGKGPLSGRWQASADDQFQIEDDGTTVEIKLIRSDNLQTFSGKLTRDANEPDTKPLKGDLDAIFKLDATKEYKISVTAMIVDANHLRLNCSGCPVWKNGRKLPGSRDSKVVWTRSSNTPGKKTGD